jgi:hypothetical protein
MDNRLDTLGAVNHAHGPATDAPGKLRALIGHDEEARAAAMDYLWGAILHQGSPWMATAPVARFVAGVLDDPHLDTGHATVFAGSVRSYRSHLIDFLAGVMKAGRPDLSDEQVESWMRDATEVGTASVEDDSRERHEPSCPLLRSTCIGAGQVAARAG